ncbi:MAG: hypothetical protein EOL97_13790 [Spirochaetia bacterium]|nr:hypothetical protein [Spirochaetia bacterium]
MSVRKYPGRLKKYNIFEILPFVVSKYPSFEPTNILTKEVIASMPKDTLKEAFDFLNDKKMIRDIIYSTEDYNIKCLWCGQESMEMGLNIRDYNKKHKKVCKNSFLYIDYTKNTFNVIKVNYNIDGKEFHYIQMNNFLTNSISEFKLKKRYERNKYLIYLENMQIQLKELKRKYNNMTISAILNMNSEYIMIKKK